MAEEVTTTTEESTTVTTDSGSTTGLEVIIQPYTAPNCPYCGQYMDKVTSWVCKQCGQLSEKE